MSGSYLTDERRMIQEQARDFTIREVLPVANKLDPEKGAISMALREEMAEMGYVGILVDKKYGGLGLGVFEYCLVTEEPACGWMGVASIIARANNVPGMEKLSEERRAEIMHWVAQVVMPWVARVEWLGAFAMSEPNAGSDDSSCRARRDGDSWVIHGNKYWCTFADGSDYQTVIARTSAPPPGKQHKGCRLSSSLKSVGSSQRGCVALRSRRLGITAGRLGSWRSMSAVSPQTLFLVRRAKVSTSCRRDLRRRGRTRRHVLSVWPAARWRIPSATPENASRSTTQSHAFRRSGSRSRKWRLRLEPPASYSVCTQINSGGRCDLEASMTKLYATDMAERVPSEAMQIHGGARYTTLHAVERHWRDARLTKIFKGTSESQLRIILDRLLGK